MSIKQIIERLLYLFIIVLVGYMDWQVIKYFVWDIQTVSDDFFACCFIFFIFSIMAINSLLIYGWNSWEFLDKKLWGETEKDILLEKAGKAAIEKDFETEENTLKKLEEYD